MKTRDLWNSYAKYFNAEEFVVFPPDHPEIAFYKEIRNEMSGLCLEIGAGSGRLASALSGKSLTVALEPSDSMLDGWSSSDTTLAGRVQSVGERMPFKTDSFPLVCFPYNGLQCVPEEETRQRIIEEAFRVTAQSGFFLIEVSPVFSRRDSERLTERYRAELPDGSHLILKERVERITDPDSIRYHMFYTTVKENWENTELITLDLAAITRDRIIGILEETGFSVVEQWGNYDRCPYDDDISPRLLVLAKKGE